MNELQTKQLVFLEDTIAHFNSTNRGVDEYGHCYYSRGCAIGRKISKKLCEEFDKGRYTVDMSCVFDKLPNELQELDRDFLSDIQRLHDVARFWNEKGLSEDGSVKVIELKLQYKLE